MANVEAVTYLVWLFICRYCFASHLAVAPTLCTHLECAECHRFTPVNGLVEVDSELISDTDDTRGTNDANEG